MNVVTRLLSGLSCVALALPLLANSASAEEKGEGYKRLKHGDFSGSSLFDSFGSDRYRPARRSKLRAPGASPEELGDETPLAQEILVYQPEELTALKQAKFSDPIPGDPLAAAVYGEFLDPDASLRVTPVERKAIITLYESNGFKPLWTDAQGLTGRGQDILKVLANSSEDAMDPADYLPSALGSFGDDPAAYRGDYEHLARLDLGLTAMALKYAREASSGRLIPNRLTVYNDFQPARADPAVAMKILAFSPYAASWLRNLQPHHPAYGTMKAAYLELLKSPDLHADPIPAGPKIKPGQHDRRLPELRKILIRLGYPQARYEVDAAVLPPFVRAEALAREAALDSGLTGALKAFQEKSHLKPTGTLDAATITALNQHNPREALDRLALNMDRMRWLPKDLGKRYVIMNQAAFELKIIDDGREEWRTNVIVGRPETQTVAFDDEMEMVVFNPSWGVPQSIIAKEMLPILRRDPSYLDREGYRVILPNGRIVKSRSINWSIYGNKIPLSIQQPPSGDNALGEIKFLFPNAHDIYMHDTPTKALFAKSMRAFSHGCVRVENPREFATHVMGLSRSEIDAQIDSGESTTVKLAHKLPVHLVYFTAWPDKNGKIVYYDDVYGRDARMEKAYSESAMAAK